MNLGAYLTGVITGGTFVAVIAVAAWPRRRRTQRPQPAPTHTVRVLPKPCFADWKERGWA